MLKTIYRMEAPNGDGPFQYVMTLGQDEGYDYMMDFSREVGWLRVENGFFGVSMLPNHDHPHHIRDTTLPDDLDEHEWKVGCDNLDQLMHWFPLSSWQFFKEHGFELVEYECDCQHIHFGQWQVLFCVDNVTVKKRLQLI